MDEFPVRPDYYTDEHWSDGTWIRLGWKEQGAGRLTVVRLHGAGSELHTRATIA